MLTDTLSSWLWLSIAGAAACDIFSQRTASADGSILSVWAEQSLSFTEFVRKLFLWALGDDELELGALILTADDCTMLYIDSNFLYKLYAGWDPVDGTDQLRELKLPS